MCKDPTYENLTIGCVGVEFKVVTKDMADDIKNFLWENFFPDEPISRWVQNN